MTLSKKSSNPHLPFNLGYNSFTALMAEWRF